MKGRRNRGTKGRRKEGKKKERKERGVDVLAQAL